MINDRDQVLENGEEATANVPAGGFNIFRLEANTGDVVDVSVGEDSGSQFRSPRLTVFGPNGVEIATDVDGVTAQLEFTAAQSGIYTAVVEEDGRDQPLDFRIRALTLPGTPQIVDGRDRVLENGEEVIADIPIGVFNVHPFEVTAGAAVDVSLGGISGTPMLTIFGPGGTELGTGTGSGANLEFIATQTGTYTAVVEEAGRNSSLSYRLRTLTGSSDPFVLGVGRDETIADSVEVAANVPVGTFNAYPFETSAGQTVAVSVEEAVASSFTSPKVTVFGPDGLVVGSDTDSSIAQLTFTATQTGIYTAVVEEDGRDRSLSFRIEATGITQLRPEIIRQRRDNHPFESIEQLARPNLLNVVDVSFNQDVQVSSNSFQFFNETTQTAQFVPAQAFSYDANTFTATWDVSNFLPPLFQAGLYTISASASAITAVSDGRAMVDGFSEQVIVALPGDANLDGRVDVLGDAFRLVANLGLTGGATWADGDFNGDGNVDVLTDAFLLVANLGKTVFPASSSLSAATLLTSTEFALAEPAAVNAVSPVLLDAAFEDDDEEDNGLVSPLDAVFAGKKEFLQLW